MELYSGQINKLIDELAALPGIGSKSAQRLAFHLINMPKERVDRLANVMIEARANVRYCKECYTLTDKEICPVCANPRRDHHTIMVVENTRDLAAYEKTGKYEGVYHVLHGAISPMLGVGPGDIKLKELMERLQGDVEEVIIATNSSLEGETTAMYISKLIKPTGIKVTRIASGVPVGGDLEYIDEVTLLRALEGNLEPVECAGLDPEGECKGADSCVTKYVWKRINDSINRTVDEIWLNQLVTESKCLGHADNHLDYTKCKN